MSQNGYEIQYPINTRMFDPIFGNLGYSGVYIPTVQSRVSGIGDAELKAELKRREDQREKERLAAEARLREEEAKRPKVGDIVKFKFQVSSIRILLIDPASDTARFADQKYGKVGSDYIRGVRVDASSKVGAVHDAKLTEVEKA